MDFDLVDIHERVFELAYTTYWMFARMGFGKSPSHWPWHKLPGLLTAYQDQVEVDLSVEELQSFPFEMARVPLYWIATAGYEADPVSAMLDRVGYAEKSSWLLTHTDAVWVHCHT